RPPRSRARACAGSSWLPEDVADAAHGLDQPRLTELAAQVADVDLERVGARAEVVAPHVLEDLRAREHLARMLHEQLEQEELGAGELDRALAAGDRVAGRVELQVGVAEHLAHGSAAAAQQGS